MLIDHARLINAERDCILDWMEAFQAIGGNPFRADFAHFGGATAVTCNVPAEIWNRVFNFTPADLEFVPDILRWYQEHHGQALFDLNPYTTTPAWEAPHMLRQLAETYGMFHASNHQMLYGTPTLDVPAPPAHIVIREVGEAEAEDFKTVYEQVWGSGEAITCLIGQPNFRSYLAYIDGKPASIGVVHIAKGAASMANGLTIPAMRGRGAQTALLYHRIRQAALEGCDLLVSQCRPGSQSQYNQLKVGFKIAGTKAWWISLP